jgi:hypothetical protein
MIDEQLEGLNIETPEVVAAPIDYENQKFVCYGIRCQKGKVIVTINNKNVQSFLESDFPETIDFNQVDQVSEIIEVVRQGGLQSLIDKYELPTD